MDINAIKLWSGNLVAVTLNLQRCAAAFMAAVIQISARTWIHCRHQHETAGEGDTGRRTGNRHYPIFQRLPQHFQRIAVKLRQFIQKKHTAMRKADSPGAGCVPPPSSPASDTL